MPWNTSTRRGQLPANWLPLRQAILQRDRWICQINGPECQTRATEVDHIQRGNDHRPSNLQAVCHRCHALKTQRESMADRPPRNRPPEQHPGYQ